MFRPRLLYRLEEQLNARINEPAFVYEALKVYLMVGGLQSPDRELIRSWMQRDWADNLYPGATNAEGRRLLDENLVAMFDLETEQQPLVELDGRLIKQAQSSLARLSVSQRAYEFLKSEARASTAGDWIASRHGGPDMGVVFETTTGQPLDAVRVPEFFTYNGFHQKFVARLSGLSERMKRERWVLGDAGQQSAIDQQYDNLAGDLLNIYSNDFVTTWRTALGSLRLKKLLADKPKYEVLRALSAPTSPMRQILESVRDETVLTKERAKPANASAPAAAPAPALFTNAQDGPPGATIEAQFKPYHAALEGESTRRPIDSTVANLNDIAQNLTLIIENPQLTAQATAALQTQVAALRNNASRMPPPFSDMLRAAAAEFEGSIAASTAGQILQTLRDQVTPVCQQTVTNRYPFVRSSGQEVPLADFAKLFSPNGVMDKFFTQYLAPYADTSRSDWAWRKESPVGRSFSPDTLKQFQNAAYIRDAFFQTGGGVPAVSFAIRPPGAPGPGVTVKTEIGGTTIASPTIPGPATSSLFGGPQPTPPPPPPPQSNSPTTVLWPGPAPRTAISVSNDTGAPSVLERIGPWSLFRMLEAGSLVVKAETASATFIVAGRELNYQISTGSLRNPLNLSVLREFRCPTGI